MRRSPPTPLLLATALFASSALAADSELSPESSAAPATSPVLLAAESARNAPPAAAPTALAMSPTTAAKFAATRPKFSPPKTDAPPPAPAEPDKPLNGIIRLPSYVVREAHIRRFDERELLTPQGKLKLGLKRRPGLRFLNFFGLNNGLAVAMLEEDFRAERIAEMNDLAGLFRYSDADSAKTLQREGQRAFMRPSSWVETGGPRVNPYSRQ